MILIKKKKYIYIYIKSLLAIIIRLKREMKIKKVMRSVS